MIAVSACLAGMKCRYDGNDNEIKEIVELVKLNKAILICPEQLGGMQTPRKPCEIRNNRVIDKDEIDRTKEFEKGAQEALKICKLYGIKEAILKANSPSCGNGCVYDGTFSGKKISGNGVTANLFVSNGIEVKTEKEL